MRDSDIEVIEKVYTLSDEHVVQSRFDHQGILLFQVKADKLKYYKAQSFERFEEGVWLDTSERAIDDGDLPIDPALIRGDHNNNDLFIGKILK